MYHYYKLAGSRNSAFSELRVSPDEEKKLLLGSVTLLKPIKEIFKKELFH